MCIGVWDFMRHYFWNSYVFVMEFGIRFPELKFMELESRTNSKRIFHIQTTVLELNVLILILIPSHEIEVSKHTLRKFVRRLVTII